MVFAGIWATLVYFPVAHWVFDFDGFAAETGGWIANQLKAIDFAGGTAVHINAGAAGLALALVLGKRVGFGKEPMRPHNLPSSCSAPACCGSAGSASTPAPRSAPTAPPAVVWVNTLVATGAAMLGWLLVEKIRDGHATSLGAASGVVAGLVAITPACCARSRPSARSSSASSPVSLCALAVGLKFRFGYDDSLDVVGVHLVGGLVGTLAHRLPRHRGGPGRCRRPVLRRRPRPALAPGRRRAARSSSFSFVVDATSSAGPARRRSASGSTARTRSPASTWPEHAETGYDLGGYAGGRVGVHRSSAEPGRPPTQERSRRVNA